MRRSVPLLSGFAILAVVFNHANWHVLERFASGDPAGLPYLIADQVGKCAIAAFLAIAGYFIAYATAGGKTELRWPIINARLSNLLWPWLIWSGVDFALHVALTRQVAWGELVATPFVHYYFIPLLMAHYLVTPWLARWARHNPRRLLLGAALVQVLALALFYARLYSTLLPAEVVPWLQVGPLHYLRFAFFFSLGLVLGLYPLATQVWLARLKPILPWLTLALFSASVGEAWIAYGRGGEFWPLGGDQTKLTSTLFSISLILTFASAEHLRFPGDRLLTRFGARTYGLYLTHYIFLGAFARVLEGIWPTVPGWVLLPVLFVATAGAAMVLMEVVARTPARKLYGYLFG